MTEMRQRCNQQECLLGNEAALEELAERAADRAIQKLTEQVYQEVGKGVVRKLFWIAGALLVAAYVWVTKGSSGGLPLPGGISK